jgi:hypothetical protein
MASPLAHRARQTLEAGHQKAYLRISKDIHDVSLLRIVGNEATSAAVRLALTGRDEP